MRPQGKAFLIVSIILAALGLILLIAKSVAPGIICIVIGAIRLLLPPSSKHKPAH